MIVPPDTLKSHSTKNKGASILDEAKEVVNGRRDSYGSPEDCFELIANFWSTYLSYEISQEEVCMMMILLKVAREKHGHKRDNLVDIAGYSHCSALIQGAKKIND